MASNSLYLSVMTPPVNSGTISIRILAGTFSSTNTVSPDTDISGETGLPEGLNTTTVADFTVPVTVTGTESEIDLATEIYQALGTYIIANDFNYQGWLAYAEEPYSATFQCTMTDHVIAIWSQTVFRVLITANNTGSVLIVSNRICLANVARSL